MMIRIIFTLLAGLPLVLMVNIDSKLDINEYGSVNSEQLTVNSDQLLRKLRNISQRTNVSDPNSVENSLILIRNAFCLAFKNILIAEGQEDEVGTLQWAQTALTIRDHFVDFQRKRGISVPESDPFYGQKELVPICFPKLEDLITAKKKLMKTNKTTTVTATTTTGTMSLKTKARTNATRI